MTLSSQYGLTVNDILSRLGDSAEFSGEIFFEIRAVYRTNNGKTWKLCSASIQKGRAIESVSSEIYQNNAFFIVYKKFTKAWEIFHCLCNGGIEINPFYPTVQLSEGTNWNEVLVPSVSSCTAVPRRHYTAKIESCNYGDEPLVGFKLPYYSSFNKKLHEFIEHEKSDNNNIHIVIEDPRVRLVLDNETIKLEANRDISLVGKIEKDKHVKEICFDNTHHECINITDATEVELWVIDENNIIYDYMSSSTYPYRFETKKKEMTIEEIVREKIDNGESIDCEFKKFIDLKNGDSKAEEIDKTVCAFSNTNGGHLIIGVDDNGNIVGIEEEVRKSYKTSLKDAVHEYINGIRKRLYENLTINDCFAVSQINICEKVLIIIQTEKSSGWNFLQATDIPYKRKGATNYNAVRLVALQNEATKSNLNRLY